MDNKILKISEDVSWIGVLDPALRVFDIIMTTEHGTTYNSYFINAEKKTVVETVKEPFFDTYEAKLRQVCNPEDIEYIIVSHTEPDHAGALRRMLSIAPRATVLGSSVALQNLKYQIGFTFPCRVIKEGEMIDLGNKHLKVINAPNLHWPDTIYTYLQEDQLLFTCDSFGAHFCHEAMFDDLTGNYDEAFQYYFDVILKPFSTFFLKAIDKISSLNIRAICPGHGPVLRAHWQDIVSKTKTLCEQYLSGHPVKNRVLVAFVSAYGYTRAIAEKIREGLEDIEGIEVDFCDLEKTPATEYEEKVARASAFILGSPTINQNMLPQLYQLLATLSPLRDKGKPAGCFGSYGWSGEAEQILATNIQNQKLNYCGESMFIRFRPQEIDYERIKAYGKKIGLMLQ
ncbi:MAG: FprA family A-type flavoprotein [Bacteroidales bacterium]|jgi:flavorubredoxin|nr:FprA family A-type flavoprotein [Bacteroidales bacterium]